VAAYVPNSKEGLVRLPYRMEWEDLLRAHLQLLDAVKPVIYTGDLNVAHEEIDIKNPKTNHKNAGFSDEERAKFTELLAAGFSDTFRELYPEEVQIFLVELPLPCQREQCWLADRLLSSFPAGF
jgi:exodeoxyribonuclease-3